jgi:hypothetical protein
MTNGKTSLLIFALLLLSLGSASSQVASVIPGILTISASDSGAWANSGPAFQGEKTLYIWFVNYEAEQIDFSFTGTLAVVSFVPSSGLANIGTNLSPSVVPTGTICTQGIYTLLGELVVRDETGTGGTLCFAESAETQRLCFLSCNEGWTRTMYYGYSSDGMPACWGESTSPTCGPIAVPPTTWGSVKSLYR